MSKISLKHSGGNVVSLNSPTSAPTSADVAFKLPNADGTSGQVLKTDGSGNLSFGEDTGGKILQVVYDQKTDTASNNLATGTWWSVYNAGLQVSITPSSASNKIFLMATISYTEGSGQYYHFRFEKDGAEITECIGDADGNRRRVTSHQDSQSDNATGRTHTLMAQVSAGDTNSRIYNIALKHTSGTTRQMYLNRTFVDTNSQGYGRAISTITAWEIAA